MGYELVRVRVRVRFGHMQQLCATLACPTATGTFTFGGGQAGRTIGPRACGGHAGFICGRGLPEGSMRDFRAADPISLGPESSCGKYVLCGQSGPMLTFMVGGGCGPNYWSTLVWRPCWLHLRPGSVVALRERL